MECLDCHTPEERQKSFALCISRFQSYDEIQNKDAGNLQREKLNLHGTLILQFVLEFNKPIKVVNSILSIENTQLCQLLSNSMGCHIADSFVKSSFIGEKSRDKLIKKLQVNLRLSLLCIYNNFIFRALIRNLLQVNMDQERLRPFGILLVLKIKLPFLMNCHTRMVLGPIMSLVEL